VQTESEWNDALRRTAGANVHYDQNCVKTVFCFAIGAVLILSAAAPASARKKAAGKAPPNKTEIEEAARLQIFLDRANFGPGKIDGRYGDFTRKALALYRESRGEPAEAAPQDKTKSDAAPDITGLDLAGVDPVFISYTVTEADLQSVGTLPSDVSAQAKLKYLPYRSAGDAIAEKFHCDIDLLEQLNPGKAKTLKPGDQILVPNVEPFDLASVKQIKPGSEIAAQAVNEIDEGTNAQSKDAEDDTENQKSEATPAAIVVRVDTKTNMLGVFKDDKMIAAYPVTIGSAHTGSPIGEWKVRHITKMPTFRYDEEMLQHGQRSGNFHLLPPGPRNRVGVMWIALNKKGIGIHGTNEPDSIGRSASHGCIRLANWDVVRVATKIKSGDRVSIH
jgi:lipoprotein-anchoring transpeptidase ErfK/SrfK